jgi:hypothetical protein
MQLTLNNPWTGSTVSRDTREMSTVTLQLICSRLTGNEPPSKRAHCLSTIRRWSLKADNTCLSAAVLS